MGAARGMMPRVVYFDDWRELLEERVAETEAALGAIEGVVGVVLGGSVGRGEPWPMSDIDVLPVLDGSASADAAVTECQNRMVDWWGASGRAQSLDLSWLRFTGDEVRRALDAGTDFAVARMAEPRWLHGLDKCHGGRGLADPSGVAGRFAAWLTARRFEPEVRAARIDAWHGQLAEAREASERALGGGDAVEASLQLRIAARALRMVWIEHWSERLGSFGREWTRFEAMARTHGAPALARDIALLARAEPDDALERAAGGPLWLRERVALAWQARRAIGEEVGEAESARDQVAAFAVMVPRRRSPPYAAWLALPDPELPARLARLDALLAEAPRAPGI